MGILLGFCFLIFFHWQIGFKLDINLIVI